MKFKNIWGLAAALLALAMPVGLWATDQKPEVTFPEGTATPSQVCGECHQAIYREYAFGFGADRQYQDIVLKTPQDKRLNLPANVSATATPHAFAGLDPFPIHAREFEMAGKSCNVCHYPEPFDLPSLDSPEIARPPHRPRDKETAGLPCASCHLTPEGKIRGPYQSKAPHATVAEPKMQTSAACAFCHSQGPRVPGKSTQTFLEWRDDYHKAGLGSQHCQDCHMPRTLRRAADDDSAPLRAVARHLWTGGRSHQRLTSALSPVIVQPSKGKPNLDFHLNNIGAGHSVPTGSSRRAMYLMVDVLDGKGKKVAEREWYFAPWYGTRPDDKKFLEEDKARPDAIAAMQADATGPHETIILAGEERVLTWAPSLKPGQYTVVARLIYDLNRFNDRAFTGDQTEINRATLAVKVE